MNTKLEQQIAEMKKQTIGVEIEMANITREKATRVVAKYFGTEETVSHEGGSYDAWSCKDRTGRKWTVTRDVSIQANSDLEKAELGTPILHYEDIEDLQEIARQLRHAGAVSKTGSYLTIEPKDGGAVPVAVWSVSKDDERRLDCYEGFPNFYYKKELRLPIKGIRTGTQRIRDAFVYIMHEERPLGIPSPWYFDVCREGYADFGFDITLLANAVLNSKED